MGELRYVAGIGAALRRVCGFSRLRKLLVQASNTTEREKRRRYIFSHFVTLPLAGASGAAVPLHTLCAPVRDRVPCRIRRYVRIARRSRGGAGLSWARCCARAPPPTSQIAERAHDGHRRSACVVARVRCRVRSSETPASTATGQGAAVQGGGKLLRSHRDGLGAWHW